LGCLAGRIFRVTVRKEVLMAPQLPSLYSDILNHSNTSDVLRRSTESKLLRHRQSYLHTLPISSEKIRVANEVEELARGTVLLGIHDELAWMIFIDGKDCSTIGDVSCSF
jgi:superkiller protein 3